MLFLVAAGDERYDLGVAVKAGGGKNLCVPGFSQPTEDGNGWMYSGALITVLQDYRRLHPWVWEALQRASSSNNAPGGDAGPGMQPVVQGGGEAGWLTEHLLRASACAHTFAQATCAHMYAAHCGRGVMRCHSA